MEMDEDMEIEPVFEAYEIDPDYEFDASRYFDFTREENPAEGRQAELWFESAQSYPPSPFVAKLVLREEPLIESVGASPKSEDMNDDDSTNPIESDYTVGMGREFYAKDVNNRDCGGISKGIFGNLQSILNQSHGLTTGLTFTNNFSNCMSKIKAKSSVKPFLPKSSTLMKPTACQLAKQNQQHLIGSSRFQISASQNNKSLCDPSGVESQAPKRQKLEGGHLHKAADFKQQPTLIHKLSKKDGTVDKSSSCAKLKLTIPREPDLETAHRALRTRSKSVKEPEEVTSNSCRFKARPFNRKILETPTLPLQKRSTPKLPDFQVFHLKTMQRAAQNTSNVTSSSHIRNGFDPRPKTMQRAAQNTSIVTSSSHIRSGFDPRLNRPTTSILAENESRESRRPSSMDTLKEDGGEVIDRFKARPLNKKIFSSKGEIGVFRNSKRDATVPMEFNFHTKNRIHQNPPTDLFSKLSLTSELQPNSESHLKLPRAPVHLKGSKENRSKSFQPEQKGTYTLKEKPPVFAEKQNHDGCTFRIGTSMNMRNRSLGIH